jgi:hypothetical protein
MFIIHMSGYIDIDNAFINLAKFKIKWLTTRCDFFWHGWSMLLLTDLSKKNSVIAFLWVKQYQIWSNIVYERDLKSFLLYGYHLILDLILSLVKFYLLML